MGKLILIEISLYQNILHRNRFFDFSLPSINPNQRQNSKKYGREDTEVNTNH